MLKDIDQKEKQLIKEADRIEKAEDTIEQEEKEILRSEKRVFSYLKNNPLLSFFIDSGLTKRELNFFRLVITNKIAKHKLFFGLILTFALVLIWRGFWAAADVTPILSNWFISIGAGVIIIWLLRRYTDLP